jgi:ferredoxin
MLIDLSSYVAPRLSIMDAVTGMEGEGPNAGEPRHVGLILGSTSPLAIDVVAGEIMAIDRERNPVLLAAAERGLEPTRLEEVELIGAEKSELRIPDFTPPSTIYQETGFGALPWHQRIMVPWFKDGLSVKPRIDKEKCIACGSCYESCPVEAITLYEKEYSEIDEEKCVRCYCCHEMCQYDAVYLHKSLLYRFMNR